MLGLLAGWGVREGIVTRAQRTPFRPREAFAAVWEAKWELMLPVFVVGMFVGGVATLVESAPMAALYTVIVQRYIHRDLPSWKDVFRVAADCIALVGGVLLILAVAAGLTDYLVYAEIPARLVEWTQAHVQSKLVFLLFLNVFLLAVGTLMDIFSAIVVVVPLILPLAEIYGLNYVHLGIIFVANLELGFLHPPLGLNLLLASVRFKKPVLEVTWATLPMLGILALGVLLITYVPWLTLGLLHWMGRA
jgi:tripartite ATP-independent transporter DctM subunit